MSVFHPILPVRQSFYQLADWSKAAAQYVVEHDLDLDEINARAGVFAVMDLAFPGDGHFHFDGDTSGVVIECYREDAETTIDLCAWPISQPEKFATAIGTASVLGSAQIINPASWAFGGYLQVHRTPLQWLKAGCSGVVILDYGFAPYELAQALGPILAQDERHAAELQKFLCKAPVDPKTIIYPRNSIQKAA